MTENTKNTAIAAGGGITAERKANPRPVPIVFSWAALTTFPFPRKKLPDTQRKTLRTMPRRNVKLEMRGISYGLPSGIYARRILMWLMTELKKQISSLEETTSIPPTARRIFLPNNPWDLFRAVTGTKGKVPFTKYKIFKEQFRRIFDLELNITAAYFGPEKDKDRIVRIPIGEMLHYDWRCDSNEEGEGGYIQLSELFIFYTLMLKKVFPVKMETAQGFQKSFDFDLYCFLTHRLGIASKHGKLDEDEDIFVPWEDVISAFYVPPENQRLYNRNLNHFKEHAEKAVKEFREKHHFDVNLKFGSNGFFITGKPHIPYRQNRLF